MKMAEWMTGSVTWLTTCWTNVSPAIATLVAGNCQSESNGDYWPPCRRLCECKWFTRCDEQRRKRCPLTARTFNNRSVLALTASITRKPAIRVLIILICTDASRDFRVSPVCDRCMTGFGGRVKHIGLTSLQVWTDVTRRATKWIDAHPSISWDRPSSAEIRQLLIALYSPSPTVSQTPFLARDVYIYTSRAYATMSVVCLSVTEVHWRIIVNLRFKFRSKFTAHCRRGEGSSQQHLALC